MSTEIIGSMKDDKYVVLVDMDGVLAEFDDEVVSRIRDRHPHVAILEERSHFYLYEDYNEHARLVEELSDEEGFFEALPLGLQAIAGWQRLVDLGYHPRICSAPKISNPHSEREKLTWLRKYFVPVFGEYVADEAIITRKKHEYDGIALIDDRPEIRHSDKAKWQHILFTRPYNKNVKGPRIDGWQDENLPELLRQAVINYNKVGKK